MLDIYLCFVFLILCSYIRHYYSFFIFYYIFHIYKNISLKHFIYLLIFSFLLSLPAVFYLKYIITNYNFIETISSFSNINYFTSTFIISTIILFYLIPFVIDKELTIFHYYKKRPKTLLIISLITFLIYVIDSLFFQSLIVLPKNGGGVFIKLIYKISPIFRETFFYLFYF